MVAKAGASEMEGLGFPAFYYHLDESDPDVVILRRQDGSFVAAFSARGATKEGILEAAREDRRSLSEFMQASLERAAPPSALLREE